MSAEHWDLDQDNTLGGNNPSPNKVSSQKAIKEFVQNSGGVPTNVKINGTSITSNNVADIKTNGVYNESTNKIATMADTSTITFREWS